MYTPIELAAANGLIHDVKRLWDAGANRLGDQPKRLSVLEIAAQYGHTDLVQELLSWWSEWPIKIKESALHLAASRRESWIVQSLLRHTSYSQDVLNEALGMSANYMLTLDERDYGFGTEIDHTRQRETLEQLLDAGADSNFDGHGQPLIYVAADEGCPVRGMGTLLKYGAHPDATYDGHGTTIHHLVRIVSRLDENPYDKSLQHYKGGIEALLAHGASLRLLDGRGESPFHDAARYGDVSLLQRLLHSDPEVRDEVGDSFVGVVSERQTMRQEQRDLFAPEMMYQTNDKLHKGALPFAANVATSSLFKPAATTPLRPLPRVMPYVRGGSFKSFHTLVPRMVKLSLRRRL